MDYFVSICINFDKRDAQGKPEIVKSPCDPITIYADDSVEWTISFIERGIETFLKTVNLQATANEVEVTQK